MDSLTERRLIGEIQNYSRMLAQDLSVMSDNLEKHSEFAEGMSSTKFGGSMIGFKTNVSSQLANANQVLKKLQNYLGEVGAALNLDGVGKVSDEYFQEF
ncbi:MAG: hypothetical protein ACYC49_09305 [Ignavibacteriaceae bacterium]